MSKSAIGYAPHQGGQAPGIFRGFVLSTGDGIFLSQGQQARLLQDILSHATQNTVHEISLVIEGRKKISALSKEALIEMRKLAAVWLPA